MNKKHWTWYYEDGIIKRDPYGVLGCETKEELENYLFWCKQEELCIVKKMF